MDDIVPGLLEAIKKDFEKSMENNPALDRVAELVKSGTATYKDANDYATWTGQLLSAAIKKNVKVDTLPDGRMYYNIADRIIGDTLSNNYELVSKVATQVQESMNLKYNIGMKAVKPKINQSRINGLVDRLSGEDDFEKVAWVLDEPVVNFSASIVDDVIKANVAFQASAGLTPIVHRIASPDCCEWCNEIEGTYTYPDVPEDIYRRHERCRCHVEFDPGEGKRQNVWTKGWS